MNQRDRRALTLGAATIVGAILLFRVLPAAVHAWRSDRAELAERRSLVDRAERELSTVGALEQATAATRTQLVALAPKLLSGGTEAEALADLNGRLALAANRSRTRLIRADQVTDSGRVARLRRVRLRIQVESDWRGLAGFFRAAIDDPATLRVTAVSVRSNEGAPLRGPEVLEGEVEVGGWYLAATGNGATR